MQALLSSCISTALPRLTQGTVLPDQLSGASVMRKAKGAEGKEVARLVLERVSPKISEEKEARARVR